MQTMRNTYSFVKGKPKILKNVKTDQTELSY